MRKKQKLRKRKPSKSELNELKPCVWVGKKGLDSHVVDEIQNQLEKRGYIKVKIQKSMRNHFDSILEQILSQTKSELLEKRGLTFVLFRPKLKL